MNLQLHLPPEMEALLAEHAILTGKDPETLALEALEEKLSAESERKPRRDHAEWAARVKAWIDLHPVVNHFVDDSRDSIYEGCGE